jgi:hypothetical protein
MVKQMAVRRTVYPQTGIYQRKTSQIDLRLNEEGYRDLTELLAVGNQNDPLGLIAMELEATEFIKNYAENEIAGVSGTSRPDAIEWLVQEQVNRRREELNSEFRKCLSTEEERKLTRELAKLERAADACVIVSLIPGLRLSLLTQAANQGVIGSWLLLGRAYERFKARRYEQSALTGSKALAGAKTGGEARKGKSDIKYQQIASDFNRSGVSQRRFVALNRRISLSTLRRALRANKVDSNPAK